MIVRSRRRGSLRIDIHCHYLNQEVAMDVDTQAAAIAVAHGCAAQGFTVTGSP